MAGLTSEIGTGSGEPRHLWPASRFDEEDMLLKITLGRFIIPPEQVVLVEFSEFLNERLEFGRLRVQLLPHDIAFNDVVRWRNGGQFHCFVPAVSS